MIIAMRPFKGRRLRSRRVDEEGFARQVSEKARRNSKWICEVTHGGGVPNCYAWPAETECVLALSDPNGITLYWTGRARAKNVTNRSAADVCHFQAVDLFDRRISDKVRRINALEYLKELHRKRVPPLLVIAAAAAEEQ